MWRLLLSTILLLSVVVFMPRGGCLFVVVGVGGTLLLLTLVPLGVGLPTELCCVNPTFMPIVYVYCSVYYCVLYIYTIYILYIYYIYTIYIIPDFLSLLFTDTPLLFPFPPQPFLIGGKDLYSMELVSMELVTLCAYDVPIPPFPEEPRFNIALLGI